MLAYNVHGNGSEESIQLLGWTLVGLEHVAVLDRRPGGGAAARGRRHGVWLDVDAVDGRVAEDAEAGLRRGWRMW